MKMSAVIILVVALFSGSAFASSCANAGKVPLTASTVASDDTTSTSGATQGRR